MRYRLAIREDNPLGEEMVNQVEFIIYEGVTTDAGREIVREAAEVALEGLIRARQEQPPTRTMPPEFIRALDAGGRPRRRGKSSHDSWHG